MQPEKIAAACKRRNLHRPLRTDHSGTNDPSLFITKLE